MDKYTATPRCHKCGEDHHLTKEWVDAYPGGNTWGGKTIDPEPEHLLITCRICGYSWVTEVKDA